MATKTPTLQKIFSLGPIKGEVTWFDGVASANQVSTGDDFKTLLQRPLFSFGSQTETANSNNMTCAITASTKTVTMTQTSLTAGSAFVVTIGF